MQNSYYNKRMVCSCAQQAEARSQQFWKTVIIGSSISIMVQCIFVGYNESDDDCE
jgi:hypothetical protein